MKKNTKNRCSAIALCLCALTPYALYAEDSVLLKADTIHYEESNRTLTASSNVSISYKDLSIQAPYLIMDVDKQTVWGTGNISIERNKDTIKSSSFFFDIEEDRAKVSDVDLAIKPKDVVTGNLYIKVKELDDTSKVKKGVSGFATTCDYDHPHYAIYAEKMDYYPDNSVWGYNVWIDCPIYFIPFGIWTPVYHYALGKRNPILLMPKIGQNKVEGWFVRTTWDYFITKDHYGLAYLDWMELKGVGIGFKHTYQFERLIDGSILYYNLKEKDTGIQDYKINVQETTHITNDLDLNLGYEDVKGYTIGGNRREENAKSVGVIYDDLGDYYAINYNESNILSPTIQTQQLKFDRSFNQYKEWEVSLTNTSYRYDQYESIKKDYLIKQKSQLPWQMEITNQFHYVANQSFTDTEPDVHRDIKNIFEKRFDSQDLFSNFQIKTEYYLDVDDQDNYRQIIPEMSLQMNRWNMLNTSTWNVYLDSKFILGEYRENNYNSSLDRNRSLTADRFRYEETFYAKYNKIFWDTNIDAKYDYNQNLYQIARVDTNTTLSKKDPPSFLDGDKLYSLRQTYTHSLDWWKCFGNILQYTKRDSYGYTPFFFDDDTEKQEQFTETMTFYYENPSKYFWRHQSGWNRMIDRPNDYTTELYIEPSSTIKFDLKTGYIFNADNWKWWIYPGYWSDLVGYMDIQPSKNPQADFKLTKFKIHMTYDLRKGQLTKLSQDLNFELGRDWESSWIIETFWEYAIDDKSYKLKTISVVKDLHCREMRFSYNESIQEWRFSYTIKAFPSDQIGFKTNKNEPFQFQGILDDQADERF